MLDKFKLALVKWIVYCHVAFVQLENTYFRKLLNFLTPSLGTFLPSRTTFRQWVFDEFKRRQVALQKELRKARSNIHLSFDLWTSPNSYAIIGVVAHYINSEGCRRTKLLALRHVNRHQSGDNIAASVLAIIRNYKIKKRVGFFILDNIQSNDVTVNEPCILKCRKEKARKRRRLRCLAHVTNLVAKAFLLGQKADEFTEELLIAKHQTDSNKKSRT